MPWVLCSAPGQLLALGVVHVADVVQSPRLPDLGVTPRPGLPPKPQSQGAGRPGPACRELVFPRLSSQSPLPPGLRGQGHHLVQTLRTGPVPSFPGHPSDTPGKGSGSATPEGGRAKSVTSRRWCPLRSSDVIHTGAGMLTPQGHQEDTGQGRQGPSSTSLSRLPPRATPTPVAPWPRSDGTVGGFSREVGERGAAMEDGGPGLRLTAAA